jgi:hypothetical protein
MRRAGVSGPPLRQGPDPMRGGFGRDTQALGKSAELRAGEGPTRRPSTWGIAIAESVVWVGNQFINEPIAAVEPRTNTVARRIVLDSSSRSIVPPGRFGSGSRLVGNRAGSRLPSGASGWRTRPRTRSPASGWAADCGRRGEMGPGLPCRRSCGFESHLPLPGKARSRGAFRFQARRTGKPGAPRGSQVLGRSRRCDRRGLERLQEPSCAVSRVVITSARPARAGEALAAPEGSTPPPAPRTCWRGPPAHTA